MEHVESQNKLVRRLLLEGKTLTPSMMWNTYSIERLSARIFDVKKIFNLDVAREMVYLPNKKKYCKYWINKTPKLFS